VAAEIRAYRKPEPYKGKGRQICLKERIVRKEGKRRIMEDAKWLTGNNPLPSSRIVSAASFKAVANGLRAFVQSLVEEHYAQIH